MTATLAEFSVLFSTFTAVIAGVTTYVLIGNKSLQQKFIGAGLRGMDLHRRGKPVIAEATGVVCGLLYLISAFISIPASFISVDQNSILFSQMLVPEDFPFDHFASYLSALLSLTCMLFLGFADDLLDLPWRFKLLLPTIASIPLLTVYFVTCNVTVIVVPVPLRWLFGSMVNLGIFYYVYMGMLSVFCTNSINILAGINGIESLQALIIGLSVAVNDSLYLYDYGKWVLDPASLASTKAVNLHKFSICMILPFIGVTVALFLRNRYPAQVFVGDTFCYFSGMIFAVVGIHGHYSKTLLLFFIPQIANFVYSLPQLLRLVPCPRHRMPTYDELADSLRPSYTSMKKSKDDRGWNNRERIGIVLLKLLYHARLLDYQDGEETIRFNNLTLLNLLLIKFGPMHERKLTLLFGVVQLILGTFLAFLIRYFFALYAYP